MAITWGAWKYSGSNGMRVGIEAIQSAVTTSSSNVSWTIKTYTENQYRYDDNQVLTYSGSISGTTSYTNASSGGAVLRSTQTHTYTYSTYGSSPGTRTFAAAVSGAYNGVTPSVSLTVTIPARPYASPNPPQSVTATRNSDTQATVSWSNLITAQRPYTSLTVQMQTYSGNTWSSYVTVATTSSTATSYVKTGLSANYLYRFQVRSNNNAGSSAFVVSPIVYMTPGAPSNMASVLNASGTTITSTWKNNHYDSSVVTLEIQRSVAGGAYANVATGLARTTTSWTDNSPGAGTNTYRIRAFSSSGSLGSAYATGNTVSTIVPPLAPTLLSPNGTRVDLTQPVELSWQHNPGGDGAAQTQYTIEYSSNSGSTWVALPSATAVASSVSKHTIAANTLTNSSTAYQWRVRTKGAAASFSPDSSPATFTGNLAPVVAITAPTATTTSIPLTVTWTYSQAQGSAQSSWTASLYEDTGSGLNLLEALSGTGTALTAAFTYAVVEGVNYVVQVQAQSAGGQLSNLASQTTVIDLPAPAEPVIEGEFQLCTGTVVLSLAQLPPLAGEITTSTVAIERRVEGGDWVQLVSNLALPATGPNDRINLATHGRAISAPAAVKGELGWVARWYGTGGGAGTTTYITGVSGPEAGVTTAIRKTWTTAPSNNSSTGFQVVSHSSSYMPVTAGETYAVSGYLRPNVANKFGRASITWLNDAGVDIGSTSLGTITALTANSWARLSVIGTAPEGATQAHPLIDGVDNTGQTVWAAGNTLDGTALLIEKASTVGTYFDGSGTLPATSWTGTPDASTSRLRIGSSDPVDFIDPIPLTKGTNEYRVTATSTAPSYRVSPIVTVVGVDGTRPYFHEGLWVFLAYGPAFSKILRFRHDPSIKESAGRIRSAQSFLGRKKPVLLAGANTQREVGVSGSLYFDRAQTPDPGCRDDSSPAEWLTASQEALVVMYRDYTGRRFFGMLSDVDTADGVPGISSVSFSVIEVDYTEAYG